MLDHIRSRSAALADQIAQAQQQYDQLDATLKLLDRQICAMTGGKQELDALLAEDAPHNGGGSVLSETPATAEGADH